MQNDARVPTMNDVARTAGVSSATVSRVINGTGKVDKDTRQRVAEAIERLGYTPNFGGRFLAAGRSGTIGAVIPTMANAMFAGGLQAFQEVLAGAGRSLLVASSGYDPDEELSQIRNLVSRGAEGLLLIGRHRPEASWDYLARRKVPHVVTWAYGTKPGRVYVGFDNRKAAFDLARRVLAFGHRNLAMIGGIGLHNDRARDRVAGARMAVDACPGARLSQVIEAGYDPAEGAAAFRRMMAVADPPSAIICGNDVIAAGAIMAARGNGIAVPAQVSIVGFDDIELAALSCPPLTTVRVPQRRMGQEAATVLLAMVAGQTHTDSVLLDTEIILRESLSACRSPADVPPTVA